LFGIKTVLFFPGPYYIIWKRGNAVLSAGDRKITLDPRYQLVNEFSLEIQDVRPADGGDYICQVSTSTPKEQKHTLEILGKYMHVYKKQQQCRMKNNIKSNKSWYPLLVYKFHIIIVNPWMKRSKKGLMHLKSTLMTFISSSTSYIGGRESNNKSTMSLVTQNKWGRRNEFCTVSNEIIIHVRSKRIH